MLSSVAIVALFWQATTFFAIVSSARNSGMGMVNAAGNLPSINRREENSIRNAKANEILKYMNLTVDPCNDFFDFACGNWAKYHDGTQDNEMTTAQRQLELRVNKDLQILLNEPPTGQDALSGRKVKEFYKSCLTVEKKSPQQQVFMSKFVQKHGGLPSLGGKSWSAGNYNWVQVIASLRADYGLDILIGLDIDTNLHAMRGKSIFLGEPKTTLIPVELCSSMATQLVNLKDKAYELLQDRVSENMQSWFSMKEQDANRFAGDIIRFEYELCKQMRKEHLMSTADDPDESEGTSRGAGVPYRTGQSRLHGNRQNIPYPRVGLNQLGVQYNQIIDFKEFVDISFDTSINDQVYVRSEDYLHQLERTVKAFARPTLANYIMYRALAALNFPTDDRLSKRPNYCVDMVWHYFPKIIGEMYNRKFYRGESKNDLELIYRDVSKAFEESLVKADWMDENAKRATRQKLAQFKMRFPIYQNLNLNDLVLDRSIDYWQKLEVVMKYSAKQELNRLYSTDLNSELDSVEAPDVRMKLIDGGEILTGWGLLQPSFYHYFYPKALKYSLLGQLIARELVMAFDEQGWNQNPLSPMRWDEYTAEGFRNHSECFRMTYSNYLYNSPDMFRNASKLRELIADESGLSIAFNAYLAWLETMDPSLGILTKETLPQVDFTNTQLFFINFAQTRCSTKYKEIPVPDFFPMDRHTPERYEVNGALGNYMEFAREFGCIMGSNMNPDDKCTIY